MLKNNEAPRKGGATRNSLVGAFLLLPTIASAAAQAHDEEKSYV